jgi:hypothetical protein
MKMRQKCRSDTPGLIDCLLGYLKVRHLIARITEFNAKGCQCFR